MKKDYQVLLTRGSLSDIGSITRYISQDRPETALHILKKLKTRTASLKRFPERGRPFEILKEYGIKGLREVIEGPWQIIYKILKKTVIVMAVIDSRRKVEDVLYDRLTSISDDIT